MQQPHLVLFLVLRQEVGGAVNVADAIKGPADWPPLLFGQPSYDLPGTVVKQKRLRDPVGRRPWKTAADQWCGEMQLRTISITLIKV